MIRFEFELIVKLRVYVIARQLGAVSERLGQSSIGCRIRGDTTTYREKLTEFVPAQ